MPPGLWRLPQLLTVQDAGAITWRLQLGSAFIPAVPLALLVYFCPESPRWYMKKDRMQDAWAAMRRIRKTDLQAARDLYYAYVQFEEESQVCASCRLTADPSR